MRDVIKSAVEGLALDEFGVKLDVAVTRPEPQFGDYASNAALQIAGKMDEKPQGGPRAVAEILRKNLADELGEAVSEVSVAGPGFLNFKLSDESLWQAAQSQPAKSLAGQTVVAEYSDPNPFKVLHAGHLYTSVVGDGIANLMEQAGADVHRVNFGGDVGLHVGKTMWAILGRLGGEFPEKLEVIPEDERAQWMAEAYVSGTANFEENEEAKAEIQKLNKRVYKIHEENDCESPFAKIYWTCRRWSYEYFDKFYARIGSHFEKYYPESQTAKPGIETVKKHIGEVFEESDGAIVFKGEKHGLHTRVFINSEGIPTYETKDVGLIMEKWQDYKFNRSVIITGNEQMQYMEVVLKAIEQFEPELARSTIHLTHGIVKLKGGVKMSSRKGNILRAVDVLDTAHEANKKATGKDDENVVLAAVKYSFLKQRLGGDIIYDPVESVALEGNSGPYIQYAHARARSILRKAGDDQPLDSGDNSLEEGERALLQKISEYPEIVEKSVDELMPHHICTYLYELAQVFNSFYEKNRVIGDNRQDLRLRLIAKYADTLKKGLEVLGIHAPERM